MSVSIQITVTRVVTSCGAVVWIPTVPAPAVAATSTSKRLQSDLRNSQCSVCTCTCNCTLAYSPLHPTSKML